MAAKKTSAKKPATRKGPAKKAPAKKAPAKKVPVKKPPAKKKPARKAPGRKAPPVEEPPREKEPRERLRTYREKRDFAATPEPAGEAAPAAPGGPEPIFVVQKHDASRLHYDLRLEVAGVLASWAVPKGPSLDPAQKRLAVRTEDHPLDYAGFEGTIPEGEYGGGTVMVWDRGTYRNLRAEKPGDGADMRRALADGLLEFSLQGEKLRGRWALVRTKGFGGGKPGSESWLLMKKKDEAAQPGSDVTAALPDSVLTGRSLERIAEEGG